MPLTKTGCCLIVILPATVVLLRSRNGHSSALRSPPVPALPADKQSATAPAASRLSANALTIPGLLLVECIEHLSESRVRIGETDERADEQDAIGERLEPLRGCQCPCIGAPAELREDERKSCHQLVGQTARPGECADASPTRVGGLLVVDSNEYGDGERD